MKLRSRKTAAPTIRSALPQATKRKFGGFCKRLKVEKLPREIIFNILLLLPAKLLREVVRYVCKQWCDILSDPCFVRTHCHTLTTSSSVIIQSELGRHEVYCGDQFNLTNIQLPFPAIVQGSCNGLVLLCDVSSKLKLHLMNPLTKLMFSLPLIKLLGPHHSVVYSLALTSSGHYKIVQVVIYAFIDQGPDRCEINVCTIGVDKAWRPIDLQHSLGISMTDSSIFCPMTRYGRFIAGFLYWCQYLSILLAMDVDTETFYRVDWAIPNIHCKVRSYFLTMGTALGLMTVHANEPGIWIFQKLTDLQSSEWTEICKINLDAIVTKVSNGKWTADIRRWGSNSLMLVPISLIDQEFCFYGFLDPDYPDYSCLIHYNLANESFVSSKINLSFTDITYYLHVPTLASPKIPSK